MPPCLHDIQEYPNTVLISSMQDTHFEECEQDQELTAFSLLTFSSRGTEAPGQC
jgi:hypothetical protein